MIEAIDRFFDEKAANANEEKLYDIEKSRGMSKAYAMHYSSDPYETLAIEQRFSLPIYDTGTGKRLEGVDESCSRYAGILDGLVRKSGLVYGADHKILSKVDNDTWEELRLNPQLTQYWLACRQLGIKLSGFIWDVVVKPGISPKTLTKAAKAELETGMYCGLPCPGYDGEEKETPKQYGIRVLSDYVAEPQRFFWRRIIQRPEEELFDYLQELKFDCQKMTAAKTDERFRMRNLHSCKQFGRLCEYMPICTGQDAGKATFQAKEAAPEDRKVEGITNSRLACFHRCGREYQYKYLEKIEPARRAYAEPLEVGGMVHGAIELHLRSRMAPDAEAWRNKFNWLTEE